MKILSFLSILLALSLSEVTKGTRIRSIPDSDSKNVEFGPGDRGIKGRMGFRVQVQEVRDIDPSPSKWVAFMNFEGKDDEFYDYQIFQFGKDYWHGVRQICFKAASYCFDNFSDNKNSRTFQSSVSLSYSKSNGLILHDSASFEIDNGSAIREYTSISDRVKESTKFAQELDCNIGPRDTVQTLGQLPYTLIEGYYVDAKCQKEKNPDGSSYSCWTKLDDNDKVIINYGNITIPMEDQSRIRMGLFQQENVAVNGV